MGSVVKSLLAVYRLQGGRASRLRAGFARGLEVVPTTFQPNRRVASSDTKDNLPTTAEQKNNLFIKITNRN